MSEVNQDNRDKKYNEWARRNPAIVSIVFPLLVSVYLYQENTLELNNVRYIVGVFLSFGTIIPALFFFFQSSIREISVLIVEKLLFGIFGRPAVNFMMTSDKTLSDERKNRIIKKANESKIYLDIIDDNNKDKEIVEDKKIAVKEAFEIIRESCRENPILFEFNCTYGFFRNLCGGFIVDLIICALLAIFNDTNQMKLSQFYTVSAIVLTVLLVFCIICTYYSAKRYAERVYVLYDSDNKRKQ